MTHDITDYGAEAGGASVCTKAFREAVAACATVGGGTVRVPVGAYHTGPIHLCDNLTLELEAGAVVHFVEDFDAYPIVETRWGGAMCRGFSPLIYGKGLENVEIRGRGIFDGHGHVWWEELRRLKREGIAAPYDGRTRKIAALNPGYEDTGHGGGGQPTQFLRPPLLQFLECRHVRIEGVTFRNSPFWNTHIVLCDDVSVTDVRFENPVEGPNSDGLDIDSSTCVRVSGCHFDVGDDCLCLKSGVDADGRRVGRPTENVTITNCTMRHGHGGVVLGSESAGDIRQVVVSNCIFDGTERGIRVKSRRGRGGVIEDFRVSNLIMREVGCPLVITGYYWCGTPQDRRGWIASAKAQPVTGETPILRNFQFAHVTCRKAKWAAAAFWGLPEAPIENLLLDDVLIEMDPEAEAGMAEGAFGLPQPTHAAGVLGRNLKAVVFRNTRLVNVEGELFSLDACQSVSLEESN
jgi:polygalacturonase